jgi:hypothetical protein
MPTTTPLVLREVIAEKICDWANDETWGSLRDDAKNNYREFADEILKTVRLFENK